MELKIFFTTVSVIIGLFAFAPYLKDTWTKKTKPHVFTWLIWAITQGTATAALWYGKGGLGVIPMAISMTLAVLVMLLALRNGTKYITRSDIVILTAAVLAIFVWWQLKQPLLAVLMVSTIDAIGYIPTFRKSFMRPHTETIGSWVAFALADGTAILALGSYNLLTVSYLATITLANILLVIFLLLRRKTIKQVHSPPPICLSPKQLED